MQELTNIAIELDYTNISQEDKNKFLYTFVGLVKSDATRYELRYKKYMDKSALLTTQLNIVKEKFKSLSMLVT